MLALNHPTATVFSAPLAYLNVCHPFLCLFQNILKISQLFAIRNNFCGISTKSKNCDYDI